MNKDVVVRSIFSDATKEQIDIAERIENVVAPSLLLDVAMVVAIACL